MINDQRLWLSNKFSLSAPYKMYREQYGEYAYWRYSDRQLTFITFFLTSLIIDSFEAIKNLLKND